MHNIKANGNQTIDKRDSHRRRNSNDNRRTRKTDMQRQGMSVAKLAAALGQSRQNFIKVTTGYPDRAGMAGGSESTGCGI